MNPAWPAAAPITTPRLHLEPLQVSHAPEAFTIFNDARLHQWTGGRPCTLDELEAKYRRQSAGHSPDGTQGWLNWMLRLHANAQLIGTVQATLTRPHNAELAWVIATAHQHHGYAREAALAMADWLRAHGVRHLTAHIHPQHRASAAIAQALGLMPTDEMHDGETLWASPGYRR